MVLSKMLHRNLGLWTWKDEMVYQLKALIALKDQSLYSRILLGNLQLPIIPVPGNLTKKEGDLCAILLWLLQLPSYTCTHVCAHINIKFFKKDIDL